VATSAARRPVAGRWPPLAAVLSHPGQSRGRNRCCTRRRDPPVP